MITLPHFTPVTLLPPGSFIESCLNTSTSTRTAWAGEPFRFTTQRQRPPCFIPNLCSLANVGLWWSSLGWAVFARSLSPKTTPVRLMIAPTCV